MSNVVTRPSQLDLEVRHILVCTASIGHNVNALVGIVVDDQIVLDAAILVGEEREDTRARLQLGHARYHKLLNKLHTILAVNAT